MREPSAELIVDIGVIRKNILYLKSLLNPETKFMAILKANAYGHGLKEVTLGIDDIVDGYGLVRIHEALEIRENSSKKILLMQGVYNNQDFDLANKNDLDLVVHNDDQLFILDNPNINIWIKINTGMNRLGFSPKSFSSIYKKHLTKRQFTLMSHLACSDNPLDDLNKKQFNAFDEVSKNVQTNHHKSIGNTGCIINYPNQGFDWVRSGIGIYGGYSADNTLQSAMTFRSKIIEIKDIKKGDRVGYNGRVIASKDIKIAIVYAGYADGYPQSTFDKTKVSINNKEVNIFGQVSMDLISIDISDISDCKIGDWCTLWSSKDSINNHIANNNLISYELMTRITDRVKVSFK